MQKLLDAIPEKYKDSAVVSVETEYDWGDEIHVLKVYHQRDPTPQEIEDLKLRFKLSEDKRVKDRKEEYLKLKEEFDGNWWLQFKPTWRII